MAARGFLRDRPGEDSTGKRRVRGRHATAMIRGMRMRGQFVMARKARRLAG